MTPSIDQTLHQFANLLPNWTLLPILTLLPNGGFNRTLPRERLANRGRLLLGTSGPVPFGTCINFVLMLRPFFPACLSVMSTDLLSFEHPSVLLFCLLMVSIKIEYKFSQQTIWGTVFCSDKMNNNLSREHLVNDG